ncbi:MAG: RagB/SusD family nutrient uptake outer membrane protein [Gemmatimonadaceae bacterium]
MAIVLLIASSACDTLKNPLNVEPASRIPAGQLETSGNAQILSDGAIADFECAFNAYTYLGGLIGEEFIYEQQTASRTPYDRRNMTKDDADYAVNACDATNPGAYTPLQIARQSNENLLAHLNVWTDAEVAAGAGSPNRTNLMAIAAAYAGYAYVLLGEGFCTMAISSVNLDKTLTYGGEIQRDSVFKLAIGRFTEAIASATTAGNTSIRTMALLGRARAELDRGDYAAAKADAQQVPSGYLRNVSASATTTRRSNRIFLENSAVNRNLSVGDPYRTMGDARVPVTATTLTSATGIVHYYQTKYPTAATPLPLSTYEEAQLIIAEADIRAGDLPGALLILNASRARGGQGAFTGATPAEYMADLIDQRRRELFAESQHLGDLIRFGITPQPPAGTPYHFGGTYANQLCMPLPSAERLNNPLIGS